jgi:glyoxylase-like metal-dependent hydrolase (beta-lactamase superfamily II)
MSTSTGPAVDWTTPGAVEVSAGVHRIPLPLPNDALKAVNVYALVGPDGLDLVDSGWALAHARDVLADALDGLGHSLADVRRFLITHVHRDHYTQAVVLRREFGMRVSLGKGEQASLEESMNPDRVPMEAQLERLPSLGAGHLVELLGDRFRGNLPVDEPIWEHPDDWLQPDTTVSAGGRTLEIVPTPGHTQGHVVFHDTDARVLFAGDHVLPTITPSIGFEPVLSPTPLADFLGSLARVRSRPDALLLPAHGPVAPSAHARIDELIAHHGQRLEQTEAAVVRGNSDPYAVASVLRWTRRENRLSDLDPFNQMLAVLETTAHLELLVAQARLTSTVADGGHHFWSA